ncbi:hypothetical protein C5Y96_15320 [Blastopirellula marina]|uniref:Uncharacterized protein n=1 Tax=Blastopirellula marina TaxID=124 RepID=A0A2S8FAG2_9BACT|nr:MULTISPECIES: hypothetical protein [Pirellulaceae]PQO29122.1 hypothetical protein C5Y96_15320 [Blastopirellula marina]RCS50313.1 hypothetical protein DTL36_15330 [Bremerella cremea]
MSTDPLNEPDLEVLNVTTTQFHLIHLLGLMTALGILAAIFAPAIRALESENATVVQFLVGCQLAVMTGGYFYGSYRRRKGLEGSGARLGQSVTRSPALQYFINTLMIGGMSVACLAIAAMSLRETSETIQVFPVRLVYNNFVAAFISVPFLLHISWRRHVGGVEFFEHGIAMTPMKLTPWDLVTVQPSEKNSDGIELLVTTTGRHPRQYTVAVVVSPALRSYLLKHHSRPDHPDEEAPLKRGMLFDP